VFSGSPQTMNNAIVTAGRLKGGREIFDTGCEHGRRPSRHEIGKCMGRRAGDRHLDNPSAGRGF